MDSAADKVCLIKIVVEKNMSVNLFLKTERSNKKKITGVYIYKARCGLSAWEGTQSRSRKSLILHLCYLAVISQHRKG